MGGKGRLACSVFACSTSAGVKKGTNFQEKTGKKKKGKKKGEMWKEGKKEKQQTQTQNQNQNRHRALGR